VREPRGSPTSISRPGEGACPDAGFKVTYATVNVQGSCNNLCGSGNPDSSGNPAEYDARNSADKQWLQETLDEASAKGSAGVMIIWQADPGFDATGSQGAPVRNPVSLVEMDGKPDGFQDILLRLRSLTIAFKKPVVLVHGDSHYFTSRRRPCPGTASRYPRRSRPGYRARAAR
jgi:hypothetical protein